MIRRLWERFWWWRFRRIALSLYRQRVADGETPDDARAATVLDVRQALKGVGLEDPYRIYQESLRAHLEASQKWGEAEQTDRRAAEARAALLTEALRGLESKYEPGRFCDHAADPCPRCDAAARALSGSDANAKEG